MYRMMHDDMADKAFCLSEFTVGFGSEICLLSVDFVAIGGSCGPR